LAPFAEALTHLTTIPGVKRRTAEVVLAETGGDMRQFPTDAHLASWAETCAGRHERAGQRLKPRVRQGRSPMAEWLTADG
jgi:transposase